MQNVAVIIYPRVSNHASRILKQAKFLIENKIVQKVIILSMLHDAKLSPNVEISDTIKIVRIRTKTHSLAKNALGDSIKFMDFIIKSIVYIKNIDPVLVIPHSLSVLPIGVWFKKRKKVSLIYDAHELETERYNLKGLRKRISKLMERRLIGYCDKVIVVNDHIGNWYRKTYNLNNVYSIPNIPNNPYVGGLVPRTSKLREEFGISNESIILIYQGALSKGRGIDELLAIFGSDDIPKDKVIVFMGFGEYEENIKSAAATSNHIFYKSAVAPHEVLSYSSSADVGVFFILDKEISLSYELSLPNKFFEYSLAGLYICVNDRFPVIEELIVEHRLGKVIPSDLESIRNFVNEISRKEIEASYMASTDYRSKLDWDQNLDTQKEIFNVKI